MCLNYIFINPIITITTGVAFALQANASLSTMDEETQSTSALNQTTLLIPAVVFTALTVSWPCRFKVDQNLSEGYRGDLWFLLETWYPLVGWTCINNAVFAVGSAVVLYIVSRKTDDGVAVEQETGKDSIAEYMGNWRVESWIKEAITLC